MERQIIAELWNSYARAVLPADAPTVQRQECRRAFYAGCRTLWKAIERALEAGQEVTNADLATMKGIQDELNKFAKDVVQGKA